MNSGVFGIWMPLLSRLSSEGGLPAFWIWRSLKGARPWQAVFQVLFLGAVGGLGGWSRSRS